MRRAGAKLRVEQVALDEMKLARWNPRAISAFQLDALARSLETFGAVEPVILNADGTILGGHQRYAAARQLGWDSLPAVRVELDPKRARLLNLALNRISGEWDVPMLAELLSTFEDATELAVAGFPDDEVERLLRSLDGPTPPESFVAPDVSTDHACPSCGYQWAGPCR